MAGGYPLHCRLGILPRSPGGVAERLNAPVLKTGRPFGVSRVRIPPPPLPAEGGLFSCSPALMRTLLPLLLLILLPACAPSAPLPSTIQVRDAVTHEPIANADIRSLGLTIFLPSSQEELGLPPGATIGPQPDPPATQSRTDATGTAHVVLAGNRPNAVVIHAEGYTTIELLVETSTSRITRPLGWSSGPPQPPSLNQHGPALEARVSTRTP